MRHDVIRYHTLQCDAMKNETSKRHELYGKSFITNRSILPNNSFLLLSSAKSRKGKSEQDAKGKPKCQKERRRKKSKILEQLLQEHVDKIEKKDVEGITNPDVDDEIREGKRIPRLRIKNTHNHIYATVVDDYKRHILCFSCSRDPNLSSILGTYRKRATNRVVNNGRTIKSAWEIGKDIARKALNKGIFKVKFDRAKHRYAGKVEALAEGARAVGLLL
ncbi:50S ribosomal protein L18 [Plasmodium ovale wallikeri]|uniref:50S ribosomal protein L18 n=1 Tax=Plasmodium ovale wallikeri TaxID=864142 RepID=A0A1A8Z4D7_PLAOA|nr:50S ribosomal protein L18 [Plasmodium ovale wallikeri]